jgi:hypothetical protein
VKRIGELLFLLESDSWFFLPFLFPAELIRLVAGRDEAKNLAGENPPPDSDPSNAPSLGEFTQTCQEILRKRRSRASSSKNAVSFLSGVHNETLSVAAMSSAIQIVRL